MNLFLQSKNEKKILRKEISLLNFLAYLFFVMPISSHTWNKRKKQNTFVSSPKHFQQNQDLTIRMKKQFRLIRPQFFSLTPFLDVSRPKKMSIPNLT